MSMRRQWTVGRASDCDCVVDNPNVSGHHCRLLETPEGFVLEDLGSTNGTFVNGVPVTSPVRVTKGDRIVMGLDVPFPWPADAADLRDRESESGKHQVNLTVSFPSRSLVLGRDPACDHVLNHPLISRRHARLLRSGDGFLLEDLGSTNGVFMNGQRVQQSARVHVGDEITLGSYTFRLTRQGQLEKRDQRGNVTVEASGVAVDVPGKRLLEEVSLTFLPGDLVGLMGTAGAGKTTLMTALNGYRRPSAGYVLINGHSLYANYAQFSTLLGYVPQEDIMHRELSVGQALYYSARLRLPPDYSDADIRERIKSVLRELAIEDIEFTIIGPPGNSRISGGQRRRVNLAMELLTDPQVLFLDEPTSGLDSEKTLEVMKTLRRLADSGRTILLTIHQPSLEVFRLMNNVAVVARDTSSAMPATLIYYGPAYPDAVRFFNPGGFPGLRPGVDPPPDLMLHGLEHSGLSVSQWADRYRQSAYHRKYVSERSGKEILQPAPVTESDRAWRSDALQWSTLVRRALAIKAKDTWNTLILLAQAPIVAVLVVVVFGSQLRRQMSLEAANAVAVTVFLLGLSALWFGCSNAVREIVGEWAIYHRERMVNLRIPSYVASKFSVLGALCLFQCTALLIIVNGGCGLRGSFPGLLFLLFLASLVGVGLGLTLSAVARTSEVAIALLPLVLLPMVILGGIMAKLEDMPPAVRVCANLMASRWAFEGMVEIESQGRSRLGEAPPPAPSARPEGGRAALEEGSTPVASLSIADLYFPQGQRAGVAVSAAVLLFMLGALVAAVHFILWKRDMR